MVDGPKEQRLVFVTSMLALSICATFALTDRLNRACATVCVIKLCRARFVILVNFKLHANSVVSSFPLVALARFHSSLST